MSSLQFYLLFVLLPNINENMCLVGILGGIGSLMGLGVWLIAVDYDAQEFAGKVKRAVKIGASMFLIATVLSVFFPTTKQMGAMVALPYLSHLKNVDKVPSAIVSKLLEVLKEKEPEKKHGN